MSLAYRKDDRKYTYRDYRTWSENERWELIEGVAYNMSPSPSTDHQQIVLALPNAFFNFLRGKPCQVFIAPLDVRLPEADETDDEITSVVQPDLFVVCDSTKIDDSGCKGAPDLIVEVLSPYTAQTDLKDKFDLYEKVGVKEYWLIQPIDRTVMVFTRGTDGKYGRPARYTEEGEIEIAFLAPLRIVLKDVFPTISR